MPKEEWGVKRLCPHCANRFYDLARDPMTCPVCANTYTAESLVAGRGRVIVADKATVRERVLDVEDIDAEEDIDADSGDTELDDDLLEDDEDDTVSLDDIADVATNDEEP